MNADEKSTLASFLDLSYDALHGGYRGAKREYNFDESPGQDSPAPDSGAAATLAADNGNDSLESIATDINNCTACGLCHTRARAVPGEGAKNPLVMVIGNSPGIEEDACGLPFAGLSGERLEKMLMAIGLSRNGNCFLTGVVKCKAPDKRVPLPEETTSCAAFLHRQILLLSPRIVLCAGLTAAQSLLRTADDMNVLRGKIMKLRIANSVFPVAVTYHPNDLWENEELKRPAWEDLKKLKIWLDANANE